jgi:hypothetical protein
MVVYWNVSTRLIGSPIRMLGSRYGRLTVLEIYPRGPGHRCRCQCDCGNVIDLPAAHLRSDRAKSCGCYWRERAGSSPKRHS